MGLMGRLGSEGAPAHRMCSLPLGPVVCPVSSSRLGPFYWLGGSCRPFFRGDVKSDFSLSGHLVSVGQFFSVRTPGPRALTWTNSGLVMVGPPWRNPALLPMWYTIPTRLTIPIRQLEIRPRPYTGYRVGKTHCQGHQDTSKSVSIFLRETEANLKMVFIYAVFISRSRTVFSIPLKL